MKDEVFVECKEVSIGYNDRSTAAIVVKRDLSLRALSGEMVALIGGNGIGKSTLLKTIAGFQPPLSGELLIHQRSISDFRADELAKEMSFVSTEIIRVANLTVREMVGLGRFPYTNWFGQLGENDQEIIDESIRLTGLSGYENRQINRISDGERQRAMIARSLAQDTRIIVLDEPTAFLDISNKYELVGILHKLAEEHGKCIIFSTHDLNTALSMADRVWLMLGDRVIEGIPEEVAAGGYFESLFPNNPHLFFDPDKEDFRIRRERKGIVQLSAIGSEQMWATKALERLGFEVHLLPLVPSSLRPLVQSPRPLFDSAQGPVSFSHTLSSHLLVSQKENSWLLTNRDKAEEFKTLTDLCRVMKKFTARQLS